MITIRGFFMAAAGLSALPVLSARSFLNGAWASFIRLRPLSTLCRSLQQCVASIPAASYANVSIHFKTQKIAVQLLC